jgi:hypothetical protein
MLNQAGRIAILVVIWAYVPGVMAAQIQMRGAAAAAPPKVVMARVGDREITVSDFMKYIAQDSSRVPRATKPDGKAALLREMIDLALLHEGMRREGFLPKGTESSQATLIRAQQAFARKHFYVPPIKSEQALRDFYAAHEELFGIPAAVRVTQIQFRVPKDADATQIAAIKARAEQALKRLEAGEQVSVLATELTENTRAKSTKGDLGFLPRNADPWLRKALEDVPVGGHTKVVASPTTFEILAITDQRPAVIVPFAQARKAVEQRMRLEESTRLRHEYIRKLTKEVGVRIEMKEFQAGAMP